MAVKQDMESQLGVLRDRARLSIKWFEPTERALIEAGREFTHPVEELQRINDTRNQKLIEYHELMSSKNDMDDDEDEIDIVALKASLTTSPSARLLMPPRHISSAGNS